MELEILIPSIICIFIFFILISIIQHFLESTKKTYTIIFFSISGMFCGYIWYLLTSSDSMFTPLLIGVICGMLRGLIEAFLYSPHNQSLNSTPKSGAN